MTKIANISLDIRKNNAVNNDPIVLRQGDSDVIIEATISNDGYPDLEIDFATFVAKKPDGTIISNDPVNVNGNTISYPVSKHLTESVGKIQDAYFMINNEVTTNGFDISIIPSTQLNDTSVDYIPGLENINKFLESTEADWLGRIQQMKTQIAGLDIPTEFKLLMDKALSDAKNQYQPTIDSAEENVENIVADLAAKKMDLENNSDELNQTITTIKAQVSSITSFLDTIQKQIIDANSSFTAGQQTEISQSIADGQKKLADSIASMQSKFETDSKNLESQVAQTIADLKSSSNSAITDMQNNQSTAMAKVNQNIADTQASIQQIQQSAKSVNDSIQNLQIGGRNLLLNTSNYSTHWTYDVTPSIDTSQMPAILHYPSTTITSDASIIAQQNIGTILQPSTTYTASFYAKGSGNFKFYCFPAVAATVSSVNGIAPSSTSADCNTTIPLTSSYELYTITFTTLSNISDSKAFLLRQDYDSNSPTVEAYVYGIKLEKGNVATDWTPAPEDKVNVSDTANWQKQKITQDGSFCYATCPNGTDFGEFLKSNEVPLGFSITRDENTQWDWLIEKESPNYVFGLVQDAGGTVYHLEVTNGTYQGYKKVINNLMGQTITATDDTGKTVKLKITGIS